MLAGSGGRLPQCGQQILARYTCIDSQDNRLETRASLFQHRHVTSWLLRAKHDGPDVEMQSRHRTRNHKNSTQMADQTQSGEAETGKAHHFSS